jgi:putative ABC transport system permease protein
MIGYHIRIAAKSLRRTPALSALLIAAITLGICVSTTFTTLRHAFAKDPMPGKSSQIFYVRMDNWDPATPYDANNPKAPPTQITYRDMRELMKSNIPTHQTGSYQATFFVHPPPKMGKPYQEVVRMTFSDFFTMFDVPFQYGGPWDKRADAKPEPVIVIDQITNEKLFGGANSVGKSVRIEERDYRVVGVIAKWRPTVRFYDMTQDWTAPPNAIYMPFNFTQPMQIRTAGNSDGWKPETINTFDDFLNADVDWIQYWVELPTLEKQQAFRDLVDSYTRDQKKRGRFQRPLNNHVTNIVDLMEEWKVVRPEISAMAAVSLLFLAVCSLNLVGLLLGKFLARAPEVSVRRALGASRAQVFAQHIIECELIGVIGGALGILLSIGVVFAIAKVLPGNVPIRLDAEMAGTAVMLSLVAGLLAGIYPAWRICTLPPAGQLKLQ